LDTLPQRQQIMMNMSANNAKHANSTYKNTGSFALFADSFPLSEIRERRVEASALFPSTNHVTHTALTLVVYSLSLPATLSLW
jgi:hypothetical protein